MKFKCDFSKYRIFPTYIYNTDNFLTVGELCPCLLEPYIFFEVKCDFSNTGLFQHKYIIPTNSMQLLVNWTCVCWNHIYLHTYRVYLCMFLLFSLNDALNLIIWIHVLLHLNGLECLWHLDPTECHNVEKDAYLKIYSSCKAKWSLKEWPFLSDRFFRNLQPKESVPFS